MSALAIQRLPQSRPPSSSQNSTVQIDAGWGQERGDLIVGAFRRVEKEDRSSSSESIADTSARFEPVPTLPAYAPVQPRADSFQALQEWEGVVTCVGQDTFQASIIDLTAGETTPNEIAEISIEDLHEDDLPRLREGAIFRWVIGYAKSASGMKTRGSKVYFRRTPRRHRKVQIELRFE